MCQEHTLGTLTMVDQVKDTDPSRLTSISSYLSCSADQVDPAVLYEVGAEQINVRFFAVMNKPLDHLGDEPQRTAHHIVHAMDVQEQAFLAAHRLLAPDCRRGGIRSLRAEVMNLCELRLSPWGSDVVQDLRELEASVLRRGEALGKPECHIEYDAHDKEIIAEQLAAAAVTSVESKLDEEMVRFGESFYHALRQQVSMVVDEINASHNAVPVGKLNTTYKAVIEKLVRSCVSFIRANYRVSWTKFVRDTISTDNGPSQLSRFPQLLDPLSSRVDASFQVSEEAVVRTVQALLETNVDVVREDGSVNTNAPSYFTTTAIDTLPNCRTVVLNKEYVCSRLMGYVEAATGDMISGKLCDVVREVTKEVILQNHKESCEEERWAVWGLMTALAVCSQRLEALPLQAEAVSA